MGNSILGNSVFHNGQSSPGSLIGIDLTNSFAYPKDDGVTPNDSKGHDAPNDPDNFQNFPVLSSALLAGGSIKISGTLDESTSPNSFYWIDLFASLPVPGAIPEGQSWLGATTCVSDGKGHATFTVTLPTTLTGLHIITATATNLPLPWTIPALAYNTSEFSPGIASTSFIATGADAGGKPEVKVIDGTGNQIADFLAFDPRFPGGVRVAVGDVNGDGVPDIIAAAGAAGEPDVKIIDGTKLSMVDANNEIKPAALIGEFYAYDPGFVGGVYVAFAEAGPGKPLIVTGAGQGGGPHVKVIDATKLNQLQPSGEIADTSLVGQFYAYSPLFSGGVAVAAADVNGDEVPDIVTGAGPGGGPHIKVIDGTKLGQLQNNAEIADTALIGQFYAGSTFDNDGVFVAADHNNGRPIIVTSRAVGSGPVNVIDATRLNMLSNDSQPTTLLGSFFAYNPHDLAMGTSAHIALLDFNVDGVADILIGPGKTTSPEPVEIVDGTKLNDIGPFQQILPGALLDTVFSFGNNTPEGVFVGGA
jgi:hypothetical protein